MGEEWLGMDPAPRMAVDAFGNESGDSLMIDGESYQPSASCLCTMELCPGSPIISPFLSPHILLASVAKGKRVNIGCLSTFFSSLSLVPFLYTTAPYLLTFEHIAAATATAAFQSALAHSVESYVTSFCPPR